MSAERMQILEKKLAYICAKANIGSWCWGVIVNVDEVTTKNSIPNITWLIRMGLTIGDGEAARAFTIHEGI